MGCHGFNLIAQGETNATLTSGTCENFQVAESSGDLKRGGYTALVPLSNISSPHLLLFFWRCPADHNHGGFIIPPRDRTLLRYFSHYRDSVPGITQGPGPGKFTPN